MTSANHNTSAKHNDLMPTLKLEWVTPKISLMDAGDTNGSKLPAAPGEFNLFRPTLYGAS